MGKSSKQMGSWCLIPRIFWRHLSRGWDMRLDTFYGLSSASGFRNSRTLLCCFDGKSHALLAGNHWDTKWLLASLSVMVRPISPLHQNVMVRCDVFPDDLRHELVTINQPWFSASTPSTSKPRPSSSKGDPQSRALTSKRPCLPNLDWWPYAYVGYTILVGQMPSNDFPWFLRWFSRSSCVNHGKSPSVWFFHRWNPSFIDDFPSYKPPCFAEITMFSGEAPQQKSRPELGLALRDRWTIQIENHGDLAKWYGCHRGCRVFESWDLTMKTQGKM